MIESHVRDRRELKTVRHVRLTEEICWRSAWNSLMWKCRDRRINRPGRPTISYHFWFPNTFIYLLIYVFIYFLIVIYLLFLFVIPMPYAKINKLILPTVFVVLVHGYICDTRGEYFEILGQLAGCQFFINSM